jgi:hypothetical protein
MNHATNHSSCFLFIPAWFRMFLPAAEAGLIYQGVKLAYSRGFIYAIEQ